MSLLQLMLKQTSLPSVLAYIISQNPMPSSLDELPAHVRLESHPTAHNKAVAVSNVSPGSVRKPGQAEVMEYYW
jgi:hypothetical protein